MSATLGRKMLLLKQPNDEVIVFTLEVVSYFVNNLLKGIRTFRPCEIRKLFQNAKEKMNIFML